MSRAYNIYKSGLLLGSVQGGEIFGIDLLTGALSGHGQQALTGTVAFDIIAALDDLPRLERLLKNGGAPEGYARRTVSDGAVLYQKKRGVPVDLLARDGRIVALIQPARESTVVVAEDGYRQWTPLADWAPVRYADGPVRKLPTAMVPSGSALLATDIYLPDGGGPFPVVLIRTPYGREAKAAEDLRFARLGYALVVQDVRGKFASTGRWQPFHNEIADGAATLNFIESQAWCDGNIGMIGASYAGYTQWCAAANRRDSLKALVSIVTAGSAFADTPLRGGIPLAGLLAWAHAVNGSTVDPAKLARDDWPEIFDHRPLRTLAAEKLGAPIDFFDEWLDHPTLDDYWRQGDWTTRGLSQNLAALIVTGQFDDNVYGSMQALRLCADCGVTHRSIVGGWGHDANAARTLGGFYMGDDALLYDLDLRYARWFETHLKKNAQAVPDSTVYDWRAMRWRPADAPGERTETLYLAPGALTDTPRDAAVCSFTHDPRNPAPSLIDVSENEMNTPADYAILQARADVLHFRTPPFARDTVLSGVPLAEIWCASDCPDTDLVARLCVGTADGQLLKLCEVQRRLGLSDDFTARRPLEPGVPVCVPLTFHGICATVRAGEALVLQLCSAAKNLSFVNPNTGGDPATETTGRVAHNTVLTGDDTPSYIKITTNCGG